jgi:regulatory protein
LEAGKKLQKAKNNAYSLLRSRPRSESELRQRLKIKGYGSEIIEAIVCDLKRVGEIDDAKFARLWVESRMHQNPMGDIVLRRELQEKGISDSTIEATLADKAAHYDEFKVASILAKERFRQFAKLDKKKALKRLYDFLLRRGFAFDTVQRIVGEIVNDNG